MTFHRSRRRRRYRRSGRFRRRNSRWDTTPRRKRMSRSSSADRRCTPRRCRNCRRPRWSSCPVRSASQAPQVAPGAPHATREVGVQVAPSQQPVGHDVRRTRRRPMSNAALDRRPRCPRSGTPRRCNCRPGWHCRQSRWPLRFRKSQTRAYCTSCPCSNRSRTTLRRTRRAPPHSAGRLRTRPCHRRCIARRPSRRPPARPHTGRKPHRPYRTRRMKTRCTWCRCSNRPRRHTSSRPPRYRCLRRDRPSTPAPRLRMHRRRCPAGTSPPRSTRSDKRSHRTCTRRRRSVAGSARRRGSAGAAAIRGARVARGRVAPRTDAGPADALLSRDTRRSASAGGPGDAVAVPVAGTREPGRTGAAFTAGDGTLPDRRRKAARRRHDGKDGQHQAEEREPACHAQHRRA